MAIKVGVIGCEMSEEILLASGTTNKEEGFRSMKILATDKASAGIAKSTYPQAEIVNDAKSIVDDEAIELVFVSAGRENLPMVKKALQAGKQVRII
jgi:predicted dehydrogenase